MWWQPENFLRKRKNLENRAGAMAATRRYFAEHGFVEVDTPALQISMGMEPHLSSFATVYVSPSGQSQTYYLATSPEFTCKKLLVAGMQKIYQLGHVFRNAEGGKRHHPEFTMLEWYRVGAGYAELMEDCMALTRAVFAQTGQSAAHYQGRICEIFQAPEILSVQEAFQKYTGIDLLATIDNPENPSPNPLREAATMLGLHVAADDLWDDIALRILGEKIEPHLGVGAVTFLTDYPLCMAALARAKPENPQLAERFEMYICGLELANAFVELTDAPTQRARFEADQKLKKQRYGVDMPLDENFLAALDYGMADAAGIALGFDRLLMLACGVDSIADVLWAPVEGVD